MSICPSLMIHVPAGHVVPFYACTVIIIIIIIIKNRKIVVPTTIVTTTILYTVLFIFPVAQAFIHPPIPLSMCSAVHSVNLFAHTTHQSQSVLAVDISSCFLLDLLCFTWFLSFIPREAFDCVRSKESFQSVEIQSIFYLDSSWMGGSFRWAGLTKAHCAFIHIPTYLPTYLPTCLFVYLSICLSIYLSTYLPTYTYLYIPIHTDIPTYIQSYMHACMHACNCTSRRWFMLVLYFVCISFFWW